MRVPCGYAHVLPRVRVDERPRLLYFGKPEMPKTTAIPSWPGVEALAQFHRLRPDVDIVFFGSQTSIRRLWTFRCASPVFYLDGLAELYSNADLGVVFSPTNPSLVPYEMMACGLPVVDLQGEYADLNYGEREDIALLVDADPVVMARAMADLLADSAELRRRSERGREFAESFPSEAEMGERVRVAHGGETRAPP